MYKIELKNNKDFYSVKTTHIKKHCLFYGRFFPRSKNFRIVFSIDENQLDDLFNNLLRLDISKSYLNRIKKTDVCIFFNIINMKVLIDNYYYYLMQERHKLAYICLTTHILNHYKVQFRDQKLKRILK